jgi:hypothetical protein
MTAYKGRNRRIKDALVTILQGITYDAGSGAEPAFVSVLDNTKDEFEGYPAVRVLPNNLASVTGSTYQRDHTVSYAVIMHFPLEDPNNIESQLYNQLSDLSELIVNVMEQADKSATLSSIDPVIQDWKIDVKSARWYVAAGKAGSLLLSNIDIEVTYSQDLI